MTGWQDDKKWSDTFLPEIKRHLGEHLIGEPPVEEDQKRNTDLIVLKMDAVRIGCRIRRDQYISYKSEFTIRASRPNGTKTELEKIIEGWGDYFFYGFASDSGLVGWVLLSLNTFRLLYHDMVKTGNKRWVTKDNVDGSSGFYVFKWSDFMDGVIAYGGFA